MQRRSLLAATGAGLGLVLSGRVRAVTPPPRTCVSLDCARPLPLLFGLGDAGAALVRELDEARGYLRLSCWTIRAPLPQYGPSMPVARWCTAATDMPARITRVCLVARLDERPSMLLADLADAWRGRGIPAAVIGLLPPPGEGTPDDWDYAIEAFGRVEPRHPRDIVPPHQPDPWPLILAALAGGEADAHG